MLPGCMIELQVYSSKKWVGHLIRYRGGGGKRFVSTKGMGFLKFDFLQEKKRREEEGGFQGVRVSLNEPHR